MMGRNWLALLWVVAAPLVLLPGAQAGTAPTPAPHWVLLVDSRTVHTGGWWQNASHLMPVARHMDGGTALERPTVVVIVSFSLPTTLLTSPCTRLAIDLPLYRVFPQGNPAQSSHPTTAHFYLWRGDYPAGSFATAAATAIESWTSSAPTFNGTWAPTRALGIYRYEHTLTSTLAPGFVYSLGVYIDQPLSGNGNRLYWVGAYPASPPFRYADVHGNFLANPLLAGPQMNITVAPAATVLYSNPTGVGTGPIVGTVITILAVDCPGAHDLTVGGSQGVLWDIGPVLPPPQFDTPVQPTATPSSTSSSASPTPSPSSSTASPTPSPSSTASPTPSPSSSSSSVTPSSSAVTPTTPPPPSSSSSSSSSQPSETPMGIPPAVAPVTTWQFPSVSTYWWTPSSPFPSSPSPSPSSSLPSAAANNNNAEHPPPGEVVMSPTTMGILLAGCLFLAFLLAAVVGLLCFVIRRRQNSKIVLSSGDYSHELREFPDVKHVQLKEEPTRKEDAGEFADSSSDGDDKIVV